MYLTYNEYQEMGGTLDISTFNELEFEAESIIDWNTFNRLKNNTSYPEFVKRCVFQIINIVHRRQMVLGTVNADGSVSQMVSSQSNDGVSISYNTMSASELFKVCNKDIVKLIQRSFQGRTSQDGKSLLYKGLYPGE